MAVARANALMAALLLSHTTANDGADDYAFKSIAAGAQTTECELYLSTENATCWATPSYDELLARGSIWPFPSLDDYEATWASLNPSVCAPRADVSTDNLILERH